MTATLPRRSILLVIISTLVIAGNLFLLSAFISSTILEPNPFAFLGGLIFVPFVVVMVMVQYYGTFRRLPYAAETASALLYVLGGLLIFCLIKSAHEAAVESTSLHLMAPILIPLLVAASVSIAIGRMNALWSQKIRAAMATGAVAPERRGFSLREFLLVLGMVAGTAGITSLSILSAPPRCAENIDASAAPFELPVGATDVSYGNGYRGTIAYEFTIDESAFRRWVDSGIGSIESQSAGIKLREISSSFTITRYYAYSPKFNGSNDKAISTGLYYSWSKEDRGVYAAFDRTTGRAYYHAHFH